MIMELSPAWKSRRCLSPKRILGGKKMPEEQNALSLIDSIDTGAVTRTLQKIAQFQQIIQSTLKPSHDYGIIPGCQKPSLLKPGAEKINMLMGCSTEYTIMDKTEDYDKGFFAYNIKCIISRNGILITEGVGNCNSREKKYVNQDPYSITNTILKMAKKRSYIDAALSLASLSEIFTQDVEDMDLPTSEATNLANQGKVPGEHVMTFGKHKGRTVDDLYQNEKGYIEWLMENNEKMKPICEEYIKSLQKPAASSNSQNQDRPIKTETPPSDTNPTQSSLSETPRPKKSGNGNAEINWSGFWESAKNLGFNENQVHELAKAIFNMPDLNSLSEIIKTKQQLTAFLSQLAKKKAEIGAGGAA